MDRMTTNQGAPVGDNQNSKTAGRRGPTLLEDYHLIEKSLTSTVNGYRSASFMPWGRCTRHICCGE